MTENKNYRTQTSTSERNKLHLVFPGIWLMFQDVETYGKPLYQCIRAYKMRVAARLLRETDRTVLDIAGEFGYGNSSKFAAAFREVLGASPGEYRQKNSPSLWSEDSADWSGNTPADLV